MPTESDSYPLTQRSGLAFRTRVLLYLLGFVLLLTLTLCALFLHSQRDVLRRSFFREGTAVTELLADVSRLGLFAGDADTLRHAVSPAFRNPDVARIVVLDASRETLLDAVSPGHVGHGPAGRRLVLPSALHDLAAEEEAGLVTREGPLAIVFWGPVRTHAPYASAEELHFGRTDGWAHASSVLGYLAVMISKQSLAANDALVVRRTLLVGGVFLALGALLALRVARDASRPLSRMVEGFREQGIVVKEGHDLGALQDSFTILLDELDRAVQTINDLNRELEERVAARTQELAAANAELRAARDHLEERVRQRTEELEQIHRGLLQAEKFSAVGKLAASLAHEINNPVFGIRNVLQELREHPGLEDGSTRMVEMAIDECNRVAGLIRKLREFHRPSDEEVGLVDLRRSIDTMLELCRKDFEKRGVRVEKHFDRDLPHVPGVEDQIKQVVLNLLTNAAEALPETGGTVRVATATDDGWAEFRVEDEGCGIPADHLDRIFDPFFTTKAERSGTGLGLSVCHGIVERHEGAIRIESRPGEGTTVRIRLPVTEDGSGRTDFAGG